MAELDNTHQHNRSKQMIYWNLKTLNSLHSLSQTIMYHPFAQLHSQRHRDWSSLFLFKDVFMEGKKMLDTFLTRSWQYTSVNSTVIDRVSFYKQQLHQLSVIKHEFWTRIYYLKPTTRQNEQSKKIVRNIVFKQRAAPYSTVIILATVINAMSGIAKLKLSSRLVTFAVLFVVAQVIVKIKKSDRIFYQIPELPSAQLEAQRKMILQQSIIVDGKINSYDLPSRMNQKLVSIALKQAKSQDKIEILEAVGYNVIKKSDLV